MRSAIRPFTMLAALAAACFFHSPAPATAQSEVPKEVRALFDDVTEIYLLSELNPVNLTPEQMGQIIDAIKKANEGYRKRVDEVSVPPIREMAKEIKALRSSLLAGGDVPADFDKRMKKIRADDFKRREGEAQKAVKSLSETLTTLFTSAQRSKAINVAKESTKLEGKPTLKGTDDQFFNYYVKGVFIDYYPGILMLLEDMKKAKSAPGTDLSYVPGSRQSGQKVAAR